MYDVGLVLEGGGMRGVYTAGVLDFFMDKDLYFPYVIGVSAGACHAASYISRQKGRSKRVNIDFIKDPRYLSYRNLIFQKSIFGMDFMFKEIPEKLVPFDYAAFNNARERFLIGTTECSTGKPKYFNKGECDILMVLRASSSLPFISPIVKYADNDLLDGGISDPIPIVKAISDGFAKNIIILTRNREYKKSPFKFKWLAERIYRDNKGLVEAMIKRHEVYNSTLEYIDQLEKEKQVFVIRPQQSLKVQRLEKDPKKLLELYKQGYTEAENNYKNLLAWLEN